MYFIIIKYLIEFNNKLHKINNKKKYKEEEREQK